ncbi:disease resistance protein RUN1-like [Eucalyptus grandis]|uniref:disease resistance protein RUN1-like n=1 Tax=Eucalyptus grandis TaxID=71139 RepID=UPI00192EF3B6|nr:disease resistance protein RUN1-like [Eucalyptus grandis]
MGDCPKDFEGISRDILSTMGGLPLAIEVIGSYLYGETDGKVWQDVLKKLRNEPDRDVQRTLKISYDALEPTQKEIFLDIACFLIGKNSKFASYMWEDCGLFPYIGIKELKLRCLIKIGDCGEFRMHDQLRDLGRSIFCQGQPPERFLKPWLEDKALRSNMEMEVTYGSLSLEDKALRSNMEMEMDWRLVRQQMKINDIGPVGLCNDQVLPLEFNSKSSIDDLLHNWDNFLLAL